jgi:hypothetical protein
MPSPRKNLEQRNKQTRFSHLRFHDSLADDI